MKKILFYLIVSLSLLNNVQADCDSCRMYCADMHRYDANQSGCANCNSCVQDLCWDCSWCGGRDTVEDVNTSTRWSNMRGRQWGGFDGHPNDDSTPVCMNDNNQQILVSCRFNGETAC